MTRAEHMRWCKQRAKEAYDYYAASEPQSAIANAIASMVSDLGKHEETAPMQQLAVIMALTVRDRHGLMRLIEGFAE